MSLLPDLLDTIDRSLRFSNEIFESERNSNAFDRN